MKNNAERRDRKAKEQSGFVKHRGEQPPTRTAAGAAGASRQFERPALDLDISAMHREQRQALYDAKEKRIAQRSRSSGNEPLEMGVPVPAAEGGSARAGRDAQEQLEGAALFSAAPAGAEIARRAGLDFSGPDRLSRRGFLGGDEQTPRGGPQGAFPRASAGQRREIFAQENEQYRTELEMLKHGQAAERRTFSEEFDRQTPARPPRERKPREQAAEKEQPEKTMREEFKERVRKRAKRISKRDEQRRGKGQGRERED